MPGSFQDACFHTGHIGVWHFGVGRYPEEDLYGLDYSAAAEGVVGDYFDQHYYENEKGPTLFKGRKSPRS